RSSAASRSRLMVCSLRFDLARRHVAPDVVASMRAPLEALVDHALRLSGHQIVQRIAVDAAQPVRGQQGLDVLARATAEEGKLIADRRVLLAGARGHRDRKSRRLNSSHWPISYAVFCLKKSTKAAACLCR